MAFTINGILIVQSGIYFSLGEILSAHNIPIIPPDLYKRKDNMAHKGRITP
jgi:hypothetical protein